VSLPGKGAGAYSYRQLEQLWVSAGGSKTLAPIMAAIAMAESGGNPDAYNPSGATGLWQILGAVKPADQSRLTDPKVNAREAVLKYKEQSLSAWTTYTSGAYKKFLQSGTAAGLLTGQSIITEVKKFVGTPYVWGGTSPKGFDCSGLVQYVLQKLGEKNVPRTSEEQWQWVHKLTRSELKPGDLVFYAGSDGTSTAPGHVAIYAGNDKIYQAEETGTNVGLFPMSSAGTPVGYGRPPGVFGQGAGGGPGSTAGSGSGGGIDMSRWLSDLGNGLNDLNQGVNPADLLSTLTDDVSGVSGVAGAVTGIASELYNLEQHISWFFQPSHWVRIFAGLAGGVMVLLGVATMSRTGKSYSVANPVGGAGAYGVSAPSRLPAPGGELAPALGIAEVTIGAILLFVSFHNLPSGVDTFGGFISHLQGELQRGGKVAE
jgi:cell wall-associated NlpC family hydrolase